MQNKLELKFTQTYIVSGNNQHHTETDVSIGIDPADQENPNTVHFVFNDENASQVFCFSLPCDQLIIALKAYQELRKSE